MPKLVSESENSGMIVAPYFNDKNLVPDIELPTQEWATGYNLESRQLTDSAFMRNLMGDSAEQDFIFEDGFYPRLRHMDERAGRLAASPILLYPGENADSVKNPFYVDTNYGVRWRSMNEDVIRIEGNVGYVCHPVEKDSVVRIEAWKEDFSKHVYLTIRARSFINKDIGYDTVCPGDSVWMINSYARNKGWNYDVVWGDGNDASPDTVYRLHLHHHSTYHDTLYLFAERDSMPYINGKDTIRQFGFMELHRYQTVQGCDSITYVRMDTLYVHRKRHFYDTLHTCSDTLHWHGRIITQPGSYTHTIHDPYKGGTDTIYHLRADFYHIYVDTLHFLVERDSMPYVFGKDTIRQFGFTELHRYNTVHGCDSIIYVQLDTLYIHRRVDIYDTMQGCEGEPLYWRGREVMYNFDYEWVKDPYRGGTDSLFFLIVHRYPTYSKSLFLDTYPKSMPYILGTDTIWKFGYTRLEKSTVHGCDSIIHVYLDSYVRRLHLYDTLRTCQGDTLHWRGREIVRTGLYTDTVFDSYYWGLDSVYHLSADFFMYHDTHTDSCHIEELPYMVDGRLMYDFGKTTERYQTAMGCDSTVSYNLVRRWRHYRVSVETRGSGTASVGDTTLREDGSLWLTLTASACHRLDSLRVNGADVPARERYLVENLRGDCAVEAVFSPSVPGESVLTLEVCADSLPVLYNGREYGAGVHEVWLYTAAGCDSVVHLRVVGRENTATLSVRDTIEPPCGESVIGLAYAVESGGPRSLRVSFDAAARAAGFRDTALAIGGGGRVLLPLPEDAQPGRYGLWLYQADGSGCHAQAGSLAFEVRYPSDIIVQKWDDVLAVLSPEYNGGYAFSGYQWYRNGEAVEGATSAYYTPGRYLRYGDGYAVLLERASDGLRLLSCVYKARRAPGAAALRLAPNPSRAGEGVRATVEDRPESSGHMEVYDGMGRRVYRAAFERGTHLLRIDAPGTYLVRAVSADGRWTASEKMVIM